MTYEITLQFVIAILLFVFFLGMYFGSKFKD